MTSNYIFDITKISPLMLSLYFGSQDPTYQLTISKDFGTQFDYHNDFEPTVVRMNIKWPLEHDCYHKALKEGPLTQQLEVLLGQ